LNRWVVGFPAIALLLVVACSRSRPDSQSTRVDKLFAEWNSTDTPGCAVGVSRNGAVVYEHGYGIANLELGVPITSATVFHIASISKSFKVASHAWFADRGRFSAATAHLRFTLYSI